MNQFKIVPDLTKVIVSKTNSFTGHRDCVYALAVSQGKYFFSSGGDGMIVSWNLDEPDKGELLAQVPNSVYALCYLEESQTLVVGQNFEGLQFVDVAEKRISQSMKIPETSVFAIEKVNQHLLVGLKTGLVMIIEMKPIGPIKKLDYSKHSARVIAINQSTNEFAVGYSDHKIRIFDLEKFAFKKEIDAHANSVFALRYSPDGKFLLSGGRDAHLKVWNTGKDYSLEESIVAHMYALNDLVFSPNGKHFVSCSMDKTIKVWDYSTFSLIKVIDKSRHAGHGTSINKLIWSPYSNQLISCSDDRTISLWDLEFS